MQDRNGNAPTQPTGSTVLVVTMDVDPEDEAEFNKWYNEQHLPERMEILGYISARRFKLEGRGRRTQVPVRLGVGRWQPAAKPDVPRTAGRPQLPCTCGSARQSRPAPAASTTRYSLIPAPSRTTPASTPATRRSRHKERV